MAVQTQCFCILLDGCFWPLRPCLASLANKFNVSRDLFMRCKNVFCANKLEWQKSTINARLPYSLFFPQFLFPPRITDLVAVTIKVAVDVAVGPRPDGCRIRVGIRCGYSGRWFIDGCGSGLRGGHMIRSGYGCKFRQRTMGSFWAVLQGSVCPWRCCGLRDRRWESLPLCIWWFWTL